MSVNDEFRTIGAEPVLNWTSATIAARILDGAKTYDFTFYTRIVVNKTYSYRVTDSIRRHNTGYNKLPARFTWTIIVPANSPDANVLRAYLLSEKVFNLEVYDINATGATTDQFKLIREMLVGSLVETESDTYQVEGSPQITFTGKALRIQIVGQQSAPGSYFAKFFGDNKEDVTTENLKEIIDQDIWAL
jgi:hypothetical protein